MYTVQTVLKDLPLNTWVTVENKTELDADLLIVKRSESGVTLVTAEKVSAYSGLYNPESFGTYVDEKIFAFDEEMATKNLLEYTIENFVLLTQDDTGSFGTNLVYALIYQRGVMENSSNIPFELVKDLANTVDVTYSIIDANLVHNNTLVAYL